jgi:hypothetical protein
VVDKPRRPRISCREPQIHKLLRGGTRESLAIQYSIFSFQGVCLSRASSHILVYHLASYIKHNPSAPNVPHLLPRHPLPNPDFIHSTHQNPQILQLLFPPLSLPRSSPSRPRRSAIKLNDIADTVRARQRRKVNDQSRQILRLADAACRLVL